MFTALLKLDSTKTFSKVMSSPDIVIRLLLFKASSSLHTIFKFFSTIPSPCSVKKSLLRFSANLGT